jgi:hypothetical protein
LHLCLALKKAAKIMFLCLLGAELSNFEWVKIEFFLAIFSKIAQIYPDFPVMGHIW